MTQGSVYDNPLVTRYASQPMAELWGPQRKHSTWRRLWLALAEAQHELGLPAGDGKTPRIRPNSSRRCVDTSTTSTSAGPHEYEAHLRHDVMAHIHTFGDVGPCCRDIIHLGRHELLRHRQRRPDPDARRARTSCRDRLVSVIDALARFAETLEADADARVHPLPAGPTHDGRQAGDCLWCYDFVLDLEEVERRRRRAAVPRGEGHDRHAGELPRTVPAATTRRCAQLDGLVAAEDGLRRDASRSPGRRTTRKIDSQVMDTLSGIAQSASKFCTDLRLLAHEREIEEAFESEQVGSTAMAYKRNPVQCERVCSISRYVSGLAPLAAQTAATQWLERSLDDSAGRRVYLPEAFLGVDAILSLATRIIAGLRVNEPVIAEHVAAMLETVATEELLMKAVAKGGDRQALHERIRIHSQEIALQQKSGAAGPSLRDRIAADLAFGGLTLPSQISAEAYVGRSFEQVKEFLSGVVAGVRHAYPQMVAR